MPAQVLCWLLYEMSTQSNGPFVHGTHFDMSQWGNHGPQLTTLMRASPFSGPCHCACLTDWLMQQSPDVMTTSLLGKTPVNVYLTPLHKELELVTVMACVTGDTFLLPVAPCTSVLPEVRYKHEEYMVWRLSFLPGRLFLPAESKGRQLRHPSSLLPYLSNLSTPQWTQVCRTDRHAGLPGIPHTLDWCGCLRSKGWSVSAREQRRRWTGGESEMKAWR